MLQVTALQITHCCLMSDRVFLMSKKKETKEKKEKIIIPFSEIERGDRFNEIQPETLPKFNPEEFCSISDEEVRDLVNRIKESVLPLIADMMKIPHIYKGIMATDLFSLNTLLGSTVEVAVVSFLNENRDLWDKDRQWVDCRFVRSSEFFPDVRLVNKATGNIVFGIELKSWFLISKEGEPSFRYRTASKACSPADLICVLPWYLSDAVSGNPVLIKPWVYPAKAASEYCKRYWMYRKTDVPLNFDERSVTEPGDIVLYSNNREKANYMPKKDSSNNFGRLARTGLLDDFVSESLETDILGIPAKNWMRFLKIHTDQKSLSAIQKEIDRIVEIPKSEEFCRLIEELGKYINMLK